MTHSACAARRPRRATPRTARTAVAFIASAVLALLAAACSSGSSSSTGSGGSANAAGSYARSAVGYSHCIRAHGVPNYPDPGSNGQLPKTDAQLLGVSSSEYEAAQQACQRLLPTGVSIQQQEHQCMENNDCSPALVQQMMTGDMKLARCMRAHGFPNFPDPTNGGSSGPVFNITQAGISDAASHTSHFDLRLTECGRLAGANAPEQFE